jgi:hypothetical protein
MAAEMRFLRREGKPKTQTNKSEMFQHKPFIR